MDDSRGESSAKAAIGDIDFSALTYVALNDNLVCPICRCALVDPCYTKCGHTFCTICLYKALAQSQKCPVDRSSLSDADIFPPPKILSNMVNELLVYCPNEEKGCKRIVQRSLLRHHLQDSCEYALVPCPGEACETLIERRHTINSDDNGDSSQCLHVLVPCRGCDLPVAKIDLAAHEATCTARAVKCPDCGEEFTMADMTAHADECPLAAVSCPALSIGCKWTGAREKYLSHTSSCSLLALLPYMEKQENRISMLELENKGLRSQISLSGSSTAMSDNDAFHIFTEHERFRSELEKMSEQLGELEIRHGVLIMNQSVRLKEEVQSMRNAMQGIRHQMHFLLMEHRNWALQNLNSSMMQSSSTISMAQGGNSNSQPSASGSHAAAESSSRGPRRDTEPFRQDVKL